MSLTDPDVARIVLGASLYLTVAGICALAIAAVVRSTAAGISAVVGVFFVLPTLAGSLPERISAGARYLPSNAGGALARLTTSPQTLPPWAGFALLCGYAAVLVAVAALAIAPLGRLSGWQTHGVGIWTPAEEPGSRPRRSWSFDASVAAGAALHLVHVRLRVESSRLGGGHDPRRLGRAAARARRVWPVPVFAWCLIVAASTGAVAMQVVWSPALAIALYTVAVFRPRRDAIIAALLLAGGAVISSIHIFGGAWLPAAVSLVAVIVATTVLGLYIRTRRVLFDQLRERADDLERGRDQQVALAAAAERARIAREMHDIVAHHLTVMVALSDGAAAQIATSPKRAEAAMRTVSATGRQALGDTRQLLGVLRDPHGSSQREPLPDLGALDRLVDQVRAAGLAVRFETQGAPPPTGAPGPQLAVYRLVQEALTNTMKHAGPHVAAAVLIRYEADEVCVEVADDGCGDPGDPDDRRGPRADRDARTDRGLRRPDRGRTEGSARLARLGPGAVGRRTAVVIGVVLVDDQALLRAGFRMILDAEPDIHVLGEAADGDQGAALVAATNPDVVLMDVRMPRTDGIAATARITREVPQARVVILTTFDLDEYVYAGLRAGASGFLLKDAPPADLLNAIRTVAAGDAVLAPSATRRLLDRFAAALPNDASGTATTDPLAGLTERERDVFALLAAGHSNREIGAKLYVAEGTVKVHVSRVLTKLGLRDRVQAVVLAYETGTIVPGG